MLLLDFAIAVAERKNRCERKESIAGNRTRCLQSKREGGQVMKFRMIVGPVAVASAFLGISMVASAEGDGAKLVGVKTCKMCHKSEEKGNQFGKWEASPHAKAFQVLASDKAKEVAKKQGIEDAQKSGKCLKCHSTAYNHTETSQSEKVTVEEGVSCESCHGAGADYKSKETMKSREESIKGGMIYPATKNCTLCHNEQNPTWNPEKYTTADGKKVGFDLEQAVKKIEHPNPTAK